MATYPNPMNPVIISISQSVVAQSDTRLRTFALVSCGDTSLRAGETIFVNASDYPTTVTNTQSVSYKFLQTFFGQPNNQNKQCLIVELTSAGTAQSQIETLSNYFKTSTTLAYGYGLPQTLVDDSNITDFLAQFNNLNDSTYFFFDMENKNPATSTIWTTNVNGAKCVMGCYPNITSANFSPSGAIMGVLSSTSYDITTANKLSDLDNKECGVVSAVTLNQTDSTNCANAPCSFFSNFGTNTYILGGRMADGKYWTERFAFDTTISRIENVLKASFINSSNVPNTAFTFDNRGIATLAQVIINELNNCKSLGFLSDFGASLNTTTNAITGKGTIGAVSAEEWEQTNPQDFQNGVYGGFSFVLKTQRFIQQVILNITKQ